MLFDETVQFSSKIFLKISALKPNKNFVLFLTHAYLRRVQFLRFIRKFDIVHFPKSYSNPQKCWKLEIWGSNLTELFWRKKQIIWLLAFGSVSELGMAFFAGSHTFGSDGPRYFFFIQKPQQNSYPGRCRAPIQPETDPGHDDYQTGGYVDLDAGLAGLVPTLASNPFRRRPNGEIVVRRLLEGSSSSWNSSVVRGFFAPLLALGLFEAQRESVAKKLQKRKRYVTLEKATGIFKLYSQGLKRAGIHSVVHSSPYSDIYIYSN